jgi:hypothetical protein
MALGLVVAIMLLVVPVATAADPLLELDPGFGIVRSGVTAKGSGFTPSQPVALYWDDSEDPPVGKGTVGRDGSFELQFNVPDGAADGRHLVIACVELTPSTPCTERAEAQFSVERPPPTTTTTTTTTSAPTTTTSAPTTTVPSPTTTTAPLPTTTTMPEPGVELFGGQHGAGVSDLAAWAGVPPTHPDYPIAIPTTLPPPPFASPGGAAGLPRPRHHRSGGDAGGAGSRELDATRLAA